MICPLHLLGTSQHVGEKWFYVPGKKEKGRVLKLELNFGENNFLHIRQFFFFKNSSFSS
jgi:hypothetical protein